MLLANCHSGESVVDEMQDELRVPKDELVFLWEKEDACKKDRRVKLPT